MDRCGNGSVETETSVPSFRAVLDGQEHDEGQAVVGEDIVDELKLVSIVDGKSTTRTIEKIQQDN